MHTWLNRQRYLIDYTLAAMARQRAKNLGLLLVHALLVFALASVMLLGSALRQDAAQVLEGAPDVVVQGLQMGRHALSRSADLERLQGLRGVQRIEGGHDLLHRARAYRLGLRGGREKQKNQQQRKPVHFCFPG